MLKKLASFANSVWVLPISCGFLLNIIIILCTAPLHAYFILWLQQYFCSHQVKSGPLFIMATDWKRGSLQKIKTTLCIQYWKVHETVMPIWNGVFQTDNEVEAEVRDAGEIRGVVSSGSLFVSRTASTSVLRCLFLGFLSLIAGLLQTGQVRFPSVSQGSTHLQWYALNKDKLPLVLNR